MFRRFWPTLLLRVILIGASATILAYFLYQGSYPINIFIWSGLTFLLVLNTAFFVFRILDGIEQYLIGLKHNDYSNIPLKYYKWGKLGRLKDILNQISEKYRTSDGKEKLESEKYQNAVSLAPVGILMWDSSGKVIIFNEALKSQLQLEGVLTIDRLRKLRPVLFNKLLKLEIGYAGLIAYEASGKENKFSARKSALKIGGSSLTMIVLQKVDTEIEHAESAAWDKLMRIMTHEIMNSITSVHSLSSTLVTLIENDEKENAIRAVKSIEKRSSGLLQFVKDYRTLSEIPSPEIEEINLSDFLNSFVDEVKPINPAIHIELKSPGKIMAVGDIEQLRLVLTNLYLNSTHALKNTDNPQIELTTRESNESKTEIRFSDNGSGMDKSTLDNAFIPFYTTRREGSGIGLPLSRQMMRAMGGHLVLKSTENEGCTAKITLKKFRAIEN